MPTFRTIKLASEQRLAQFGAQDVQARWIAGLVFWTLAVGLAVGGCVPIWLRGGWTWRAVAIGLFFALCLPLVYEGYVIISMRAPTLSRIIAYAIDTQLHLAVVAAVAIGAVAGSLLLVLVQPTSIHLAFVTGFIAGPLLFLLVLHFADALAWWRP